MALRVVWSPIAQEKRKEILSYWKERNASSTYSHKLNKLFIAATQQISKFPGIGKPTDIDGVRVKIIRDYLLFYEKVEDEIRILTIWDSRQNPEKLEI